MQELITAGDYCFYNCSELKELIFPNILTVGNYCFAKDPYSNYYYDLNIDLSSCINLGQTTGYNNVFEGNNFISINLTIPSALTTCNAGQPDGDIEYITNPAQSNSVTINTI
jgi:hypothetical protein